MLYHCCVRCRVTRGCQCTEAAAGGEREWHEHLIRELAVEGDLRCGDAVVTSGQSQLAEGTPVRVRGEGPAQ